MIFYGSAKAGRPARRGAPASVHLRIHVHSEKYGGKKGPAPAGIIAQRDLAMRKEEICAIDALDNKIRGKIGVPIGVGGNTSPLDEEKFIYYRYGTL